MGSHARLVHLDGRKITIAVHGKPVAPGTLQAILKQANLSRDEFFEAMERIASAGRGNDCTLG